MIRPALLLLTAAFALAAAPTLQADEFSAGVLRGAHNRLTPAMGLVEYASEIRNPRTGETSRRGSLTLGIVVSPQGLVMTRGHVMTEGTELVNVRVRLGEGNNEKTYDAKVLGKPSDLNVLFLQIQSDQTLRLPYIQFAASSNLDLGQRIALFGVLGDDLDYAKSLREDRVAAYLDTPRPTYCLDSSLPFGYIAGPVVNTAGQAIGVVGFDLSSAEGGEAFTRSGQPLIYQSELILPHIKNPPEPDADSTDNGDAYLGVFTQPLTDDLAEYWSVDPTGGLVVSTVVAGSPAGVAGFLPGDIIKRFNGTPIRAKQDREVLDFTKMVRDVGPGIEVNVDILRQAQPETLTVTLQERPIAARDAEEFEDEVFGLTVRALTRDVRISMNLSEEVQGVIVSRVRSGSTAQLGRMFPGAIILEFGGIPVRNIEEFKAAVTTIAEAKPAEVPVFARAGSATGFFRLEPRWSQGE